MTEISNPACPGSLDIVAIIKNGLGNTECSTQNRPACTTKSSKRADF